MDKYYILLLATNSSLNLSLKVIFVFEANISFNAELLSLSCIHYVLMCCHNQIKNLLSDIKSPACVCYN